MLKIENIEALYALGLIPVFILFYFLTRRWKRKALKTFGDRILMKQLMPEVSSVKPALKFLLFIFAFVFLVLGMANPQLGSKLAEVKREGIDLMIAIDVSNSMKAEDFSPNRLQKAKHSIEKLIDKLEGDRIGIIVFGGEAYVQLPITTDYSAAKLFLENIDTDIVPVQGTNVGAAIHLAMESFPSGRDEKNKAIVIITDGENHEEDAIKETKNATERGIIVHTIGMGSINGAPIPIYKNGIEVGYKKDKNGNTVVTRLNENLLQQIAATGNGIYVRASNAEIGLNTILEKIKKMERIQFESKMYTDYEDRFQYFIGISLLFLLLDIVTPERKSKWIAKLNLFGEKK